MTREQAMRFLPAMFRKAVLAGGDGSTLTAISVFINWLYKNHFMIVSRKEQLALEKPQPERRLEI